MNKHSHSVVFEDNKEAYLLLIQLVARETRLERCAEQLKVLKAIAIVVS